MRISDWSSDVCSSDLLPLLFAAQFSLVHAGWMVAYPLAGWLGEAAGFGTALIALCALAALGLVAAWHAWPAEDPMILAHRHDDLPVDHPHLREHPRSEEHTSELQSLLRNSYAGFC